MYRKGGNTYIAKAMGQLRHCSRALEMSQLQNLTHMKCKRCKHSSHNMPAAQSSDMYPDLANLPQKLYFHTNLNPSQDGIECKEEKRQEERFSSVSPV